MQFKETEYKVDESDGQVRAMVYRSGDISQKSTVRCYTRQGSAQVMMDYNERPNTDASIITFMPGQQVSESIYPFITTWCLAIKKASNVSWDILQIQISDKLVTEDK